MKKKNAVIENTPVVEVKVKKSRKKNYTDYQDNGLLLTRESSNVESVKLVYSGLLAQKGAAEIYAHAGIGEQWENIQNVKMTETETGKFEATLLAGKKIILNICLHDGKDDWDNNCDNNYSYSVS